MNQITIQDLYDLSQTAAAPLLEKAVYPWEILGEIGSFLSELIATLGDEYETVGNNIRIHRTATIHRTADITGPCVIGAGTVLRPGAFIRGNVLIGENCVVGNSCELKNAILFNNVQVPHFNYVGDSVLGYRSHMGAGSITSNVKSDKTPVVIQNGDERLASDRKKVGAFLGDHAEIGCNSVLNPGTVVGRGARVYPLSMVRGVVPSESIYKHAGEIVRIAEREE